MLEKFCANFPFLISIILAPISIHFSNFPPIFKFLFFKFFQVFVLCLVLHQVAAIPYPFAGPDKNCRLEKSTRWTFYKNFFSIIFDGINKLERFSLADLSRQVYNFVRKAKCLLQIGVPERCFTRVELRHYWQTFEKVGKA